MGEVPADRAHRVAGLLDRVRNVPRFLAGPSAAIRQGRVVACCAIVAGLFFLASCGYQLAAAQLRWVTFGAGYGSGERSVEDHLYDYYLAREPLVMIEGTSLNFGIGMLLQAAGVLFLIACLLSLRPRTGIPGQLLRLFLGLVLAAGCLGIGIESLTTARDGIPPRPSGLDGLGDTLYLLAFAAGIWLCLIYARRCAALAIAILLTLGTNISGYFASALLVTPMLTLYGSHDTTPGTETTMAVSTGLAGLLLLAAAWLLSRPPATAPTASAATVEP